MIIVHVHVMRPSFNTCSREHNLVEENESPVCDEIEESRNNSSPSGIDGRPGVLFGNPERLLMIIYSKWFRNGNTKWPEKQ